MYLPVNTSKTSRVVFLRNFTLYSCVFRYNRSAHSLVDVGSSWFVQPYRGFVIAKADVRQSSDGNNLSGMSTISTVQDT